MARALYVIALVVICGMLALAPGPSPWPAQSHIPGSKIIYNLYATDGYVRLANGAMPRIYGFAGGREGEPFTYLDDKGEAQTIIEGSPAPSSGMTTAAEALLQGHAQPVAPLIWAGSQDLVEVRLKNLGSAAPGAPTTPLGIEFRGLDASDYGEGAPETSTLAIPVDNLLAGSGNVLVYTFRVSKPGTYAYGWSYSDHMSHKGQSSVETGSSIQSMQMSCPCRAMRMGISSGSMQMGMSSSSQPMQMGASGPIYSALDGALVVYDARDAAAKTGPGTGAEGAILGLRYDEDFVMLITGGQAAAADMAGMAMLSENPVVLVNGRLPGKSPIASGSEQQARPGYRPFPAQPGQAAGRALIRIINLSGWAQPAAAVTRDLKPLAYQARQLAWANAAAAGRSWAQGSEAAGAPNPAALTIQPGEAMDVLLDLGAARQPESSRLAGTQSNGGPTGTSTASPAPVNLPGGTSGKAPEAGAVLRAQAGLPFQVLIPGYLPPGFDRAGADVTITAAGKGDRPGVQIGYHDREAGASIFLSERMPATALEPERSAEAGVDLAMETLIGSKLIETRWGRGYLLVAKRSGHSTIWADVDGVRVVLDSTKSEPVSPEVALAILNSLGPAANHQVSTLMEQKPVIRQAALPPPVEAKLNAQGIQELTLVATAAGYAPPRFSVRAGTPVRLTFRQLGDAACAAELVFPADPSRPTEVFLRSIQDVKTLDFTPVKQGDFVFHCVHDIYKGVMTVRD